MLQGNLVASAVVEFWVKLSDYCEHFKIRLQFKIGEFKLSFWFSLIARLKNWFFLFHLNNITLPSKTSDKIVSYRLTKPI